MPVEQGNTTKSCIVIGSGSLFIGCMEKLLAHGFTIVTAVSEDASAIDWAITNKIPVVNSYAGLSSCIDTLDIGYLFSIVNPLVLSPHILNRPKILSINYHDSPLPRFAGTYATSWALIHGQPEHAISWHVIANQVDAGDILKQPVISVSYDETALTLNMKCYDAALSTFDTLLKEINEHRTWRMPQDIATRTFFRKNRRPQNAGTLCFTDTAEQIDQLYRALQFGSYTNEFCTPKILIKNEYFIVKDMMLLDSVSSYPAGTLVAINSQGATIATTTRDVRISTLVSMGRDEHHISIEQLFSKKNISIGHVFNDGRNKNLEDTYESVCLNEKFWIKEIGRYTPPNIPHVTYYKAANEINSSRAPVFATLGLSLDSISAIKTHDSQTSDFPTFIITSLLIYLFRTGNKESASVLLRDTDNYISTFNFSNFFASGVPLTIDTQSLCTAMDFYSKVSAQINLLNEKGSFAQDLWFRYPEHKLTGKLVAPLLIEICNYSEQNDNAQLENPDLQLKISAAQKHITWHYNSSLYSREWIETITQHILRIAVGIQDSPTIPIANLGFLSDQEHHQLIVGWNNTYKDYPHDKCIHELFEAQVALAPDAIAILFEEKQLTYSELNSNANQLAHYLVEEKKIKPDTLVGVCLERSIELVIAILGILKAGGAYVPLDPGYPKARLSHMLMDSKLETIITQQSLLSVLPINTGHEICVDDGIIQREIAALPITNISPAVLGLTSSHLAYIIYTSGSTGNPKASLLAHSGLCNLALAQQEGFAVRSDSCVLQFASIAFDAAISEIAVTLCAGARLLLVPDSIIKSVNDLEARVIKHAVSHVTLPPALLPLLTLPAWESVSTLVIAGDSCNLQTAEIWSQNRTLINAYGPSETTVCTSMGFYIAGQSCLHIGKPLQNVQMYVLDDHLNPLPQGVPGELYIGGVGLSRGYLNRPDLTVEKFIHNPFYNHTAPKGCSTTLYKTGDLARWLTDGNIEFLGRIDHQVKIRGFRIELGEIENQLTALDFIKDALVIAKTESGNDKHLVAYVVVEDVAKQKPVIDVVDAIHLHLGKHLPDYMIPSAFVLLDKFPLSVNGKIDRKALPEPVIHRQTYVAPRNSFEAKLCQLWQEVLEVSTVGITDNFFHLGGHSLKMIKLITKMQAIGVDVLVKEILQSPTIIGLCDQQNIHAHRIGSREYIYKTGDNIISIPNRQLLFKNAYHHHWNIDGIINIDRVNPQLLEQALKSVINEHQGLRCKFYLEGNRVYERLSPSTGDSPLEIIDLSIHSEQETRSHKIEEISSQMQASLNLETQLHRFILFLCGDENPARFVWIIHHSIIDGYSVGIFTQELFIRYLSLVAGIEYKLPPKTTDTIEWGYYLHQHVNSDEISSQVDYWKALHKHTFTSLMDYPDGLEKNRSPDKACYGKDFGVIKKLGAHYSAALNQAHWEPSGITAADIIFSTFANTISELTNNTWIKFEMAVSGRDKIIRGIDLSRTIGWLTDHVPVVINVQPVEDPIAQVTSYCDQFRNIPDSGLGFNAIKYLSNDGLVRELFQSMPEPEFHINYASAATNTQHDQDIDDSLIEQLPLYLLSPAFESRGQAYNVDNIELSRPSYIQINFVEGEYTFFWFTRDNVYQRSTIEHALELWFSRIVKTIDTMSL